MWIMLRFINSLYHSSCELNIIRGTNFSDCLKFMVAITPYSSRLSWRINTVRIRKTVTVQFKSSVSEAFIMLSTFFASLLIILVVTAYLFVRKIFSYWQRIGVPFLKPTFPFGNFPNSILQRMSFSEELQDVYHNSNEPVLGIYTTLKPSLLVRDPEIIQDILKTNFSSFHHRGWYGNEKVDPMAGNILLLNGDKWKQMRSVFSPAFKIGKLRGWWLNFIFSLSPLLCSKIFQL